MRVLIAGLVGVNALSLNHNGKFDVKKLNPDRVAELLRQTEEEWVDFAVKEKNSQVAQSKMVASCGDIASSIIDASRGDKDRVEEYFREVCTQQDGRCQSFASSVLKFMSDDAQMNREDFDKTKFCNSFWSGNIAMYAEKAAADRAAAAKTQQEEAARRLAAEVARKEAARKAEAERRVKVEAAKKAAAEKELQRKIAFSKAQVEKQLQKMEKEKAAKEKLAAERKAAAIPHSKPVTSPVPNQKSAPRSPLASSFTSAFSKFESTLTNTVSSLERRFLPARGGNTMADIYTHGKEAEPLNHSVYQTSLAHSNMKAAGVVDDLSNLHKARAEGKAEVARKVKAIKERIDAKFGKSAAVKAPAVNLKKVVEKPVEKQPVEKKTAVVEKPAVKAAAKSAAKSAAKPQPKK